jgi:hypothetical protein
MKKPRQEAAEPVSWRVYRVYMMRTTATYLGSVVARDATEALEKAITQLAISPTERLRLGVVRE